MVDKILNVLPSTRMVQLRTPKFKRTLYTTSPVTPGHAYGGSAVARLGTTTTASWPVRRLGTYENTAVEYPYLASETAYVPMGGETCNPNPPRSRLPNRHGRTGRFHCSYLNTDYHTGVLGSWHTGLPAGDHPPPRLPLRPDQRNVPRHGRREEALCRPPSTSRTTAGPPPFNPRGLELVLRNTSTWPSTACPSPPTREVAAGSDDHVTQTLTLPAPSRRAATRLLLNLPDPATPSRPILDPPRQRGHLGARHGFNNSSTPYRERISFAGPPLPAAGRRP